MNPLKENSPIYLTYLTCLYFESRRKLWPPDALTALTSWAQWERALIAARCRRARKSLFPSAPTGRTYKLAASLPCHAFALSPPRTPTKLRPSTFFGKKFARGYLLGNLPPPIYTVRKIIPVLKRVCEKIGLRNSSRYSTHAFRLGASQEMKEKGSKRHTISIIRDWRSLSFGC